MLPCCCLQGDHDRLEAVVAACDNDILLMFTASGRVYSRRASAIPESSRNGQGTSVAQLLGTDGPEILAKILPVNFMTAAAAAAAASASASASASSSSSSVASANGAVATTSTAAVVVSNADAPKRHRWHTAASAATTVVLPSADDEAGASSDEGDDGEEGEEASESDSLVLLSSRGKIKRISLPALAALKAPGKQVMKLQEGDRLSWVERCR